jgi:predicted helicase
LKKKHIDELNAIRKEYKAHLKKDLSNGPRKAILERIAVALRKFDKARTQPISDEDVLSFIVDYILAIPISAAFFGDRSLVGNPLKGLVYEFLKGLSPEVFSKHAVLMADFLQEALDNAGK